MIFRLPAPRDFLKEMPAICIKICESLAARTRGEYLNIVGPFTSSFYQTSSGGVLLEAVTYIRVAFWGVPATTFFSSKLKNDLAHGGICCSRRRVKMASRKRQPRDGANFAPSHFFAKKRKIDSFPSLISPKKCEKRECRRAKMASRM